LPVLHRDYGADRNSTVARGYSIVRLRHGAAAGSRVGRGAGAVDYAGRWRGRDGRLLRVREARRNCKREDEEKLMKTLRSLYH
jgi:hypothetical protein